MFMRQYFRSLSILQSKKSAAGTVTTAKNNYVTYIQGQSPVPKIREYFYYIDHQGMLFLDDARIKNFTSRFKDKKFLEFFFRRLKINNTDRYTKEFPYLSLCGRERNYIRCDDVPVVFTKIIRKDDKDWFSYAHADDLLIVPFQPEKVFMNVHTGRIYHPAPELSGGIGLIRSEIAIEFSNYFDFKNGEENGPTHFTWNENKYEIDTVWFRDKMKCDI